MKKEKKSGTGFNAKCAVYHFAAISESKWSLIILRDLFMNGPMRFKDFKTNTPELTDRALTQTLKKLQSLKLINRKVADTSPPSVTYELSYYGHGLKPVISTLLDWGKDVGNKWWKELKRE